MYLILYRTYKKIQFFHSTNFLKILRRQIPSEPEKNVSNYVTYNIRSEKYTTYKTELANDFLHRVIEINFSHGCSPKPITEIRIVLISDLNDIIREHYLKQPKTMLCCKLIRRFHESTSEDFEYKWLPDSFKNL